MRTIGQRILLAGIGLGIGVLGLVAVPRAEAAETVVLRYGLFRGSVDVDDLEELVETGEASGRLRRYLRLADQEPAQFRQYLTEEATASSRTLNLLLGSPAGDVLLNEFSEYIYIPNSRDDQEALRTALTTSVEDDSKLSLLELLQNYPREKVHINMRRAVSTYRQFASIQERFEGILNGRFEEVLEEINL
jgi:Alpha/beta hydrolase of unknown function (DUF1400)